MKKFILIKTEKSFHIVNTDEILRISKYNEEGNYISEIELKAGRCYLYSIESVSDIFDKLNKL